MRPAVLAAILLSSLESLAIAAAKRNNAALWYVRQDLSNVYQDSAGTTHAAAGDPVGLLVDQSTTNNGTQATTANKMTVQLLGTGAYGLSVTPGKTLGVNGSIVAGTGYTVIWAGDDSASGTGSDRFYACGTQSGTNLNMQVIHKGSGTFSVAQYGNDFATSGVYSNTAHVFSGTLTGPSGTQSLFVDGVGANSRTGVAALISNNGYSFGAPTTFSNTAATYTLGLFCLGPSAMPDADRKAIERFAASIIGATYAG